ncbi:hypothetical protein GE061_019829 [Apolygus lucorum]|uniref:Uncharacterized protein n=1 Tax=Apolygus lucorum TaxID=248454 RepID=A0A6A4J999_APOLU|nr:hypothetical protein GE061_019829 [Apolygus lucorum]
MVARGNSLLVLVVLGLLAVWTVSVRSQRILPSRPIYMSQGIRYQPLGHPLGSYQIVSHPAVSFPEGGVQIVSHPLGNYQIVTHPAVSYPAGNFEIVGQPAGTYPAGFYQIVTHTAVSHPAMNYPGVGNQLRNRVIRFRPARLQNVPGFPPFSTGNILG